MTHGSIAFSSEIFLLLFADDVALISDSVIGLQRQLSLLYDIFKDRKINVSVPKTKVVVCKNGSVLARNEHWIFNGENVVVVNLPRIIIVNTTFI